MNPNDNYDWGNGGPLQDSSNSNPFTGINFLKNIPPVKSDSVDEDPQPDQLGPISSMDPSHDNPPQEKDQPLKFPQQTENKEEKINLAKIENIQSMQNENELPHLIMKEEDYIKYALSEKKFIIRTEECKFNEIYEKNKNEIETIAKKLGINELTKEMETFLDECILLTFENELINGEKISQSNLEPFMKIPICFKECQHIELMDFMSYYQTLHISQENKIIGKCLVCKSDRELSSLYVDKRIHNLISNLKINNKTKFVIFPSSEMYSETLSIEDIYNSEDITMKTILTKKKQLYKIRIYEVENLTLINHFSLGILLSSRLESNLTYDQIKSMPSSLISINSFLTKKYLEDILLNFQTQKNFSYERGIALLLTEHINFLSIPKLSSRSIELAVEAFSLMVSIIFGYCSIFLINEEFLDDFLLIISILKNMITLDKFSIFFIVFYNNESKKEEYKNKLSNMIPNFSLFAENEINAKLSNVFDAIVNSKSFSKPKIEFLEYLYQRVKAAKLFSPVLKKEGRMSHFTKNNISILGQNIFIKLISFNTNFYLTGTQGRNISNYLVFSPKNFLYLHALEVDCLSIFNNWTSNNSSLDFCFYMRFSYELLSNFNYGAYIFLTSEKIHENLRKSFGKEDNNFYSSNCVQGCYDNCSPEVLSILINSLFVNFASSCIVNFEDQNVKLVHTLFIQKVNSPSFSKIPLIILINDDLLDKKNIEGSLLRPCSSATIRQTLYANLQSIFTSKFLLSEDYERFARFRFEGYFDLQSGEQKIVRVFFSHVLGFYFVVYSSSTSMDVLLQGIKNLIFRRQIRFNNALITDKIIQSVNTYFDESNSIQNQNVENQPQMRFVESFKIMEDYFFGVRYEVRVRKIAQTLND